MPQTSPDVLVRLRADRAPRSSRRAGRLLALTLALPLLLAPALPASALAATAPSFRSTLPADPIYPSQEEVDAAKRAAAEGAARAARVEAAYAQARDRLLVLQQEVSAAMAALAAAQAELDVRTQELARAQEQAQRADRAHQDAIGALRRDAALMYQDQSGGLGQITLFLTGQGPQDIADQAAMAGQVADQRRATLQRATDSANLATQARARTGLAKQQQEQARQAAADAEQAAQTRADQALAETERIQGEQRKRVAELAQLRKVAVQVEQDRQDGLAAEAARRRAAEEARQRAAAEAARSSAGQSGGQSVVGSGWPNPPSLPSNSGDPRAMAQSMLGNYGWGMDQWSCLDQLWIGESGWTWSATNASSGAYGIPQSLPATKMASAGPDWLTNPRTQIVWGMGYLKDRYGSPCAAWSFWLAQSPHWY